MLAELKLELDTEDPTFGYYQSSNLQGVLMEQIDSSYAEQLHKQGRKPYSQYVKRNGNQKEWIIKTLTKEAYEQMITPLLSSKFHQFDIDKKKMHIKICKKELKVTTYKQLMDEFYSEECSRYLHL